MLSKGVAPLCIVYRAVAVAGHRVSVKVELPAVWRHHSTMATPGSPRRCSGWLATPGPHQCWLQCYTGHRAAGLCRCSSCSVHTAALLQDTIAAGNFRMIYVKLMRETSKVTLVL